MKSVIESVAGLPCMVFLPDWMECSPLDSWWFITPAIIQRFIAALGFEDSKVTYHHQVFQGRRVPLYTVVGHRTRPLSATGDDAVSQLLAARVATAA